MKCWKCGKEGATIINQPDTILFDAKTDLIQERERIKIKRVYTEGVELNPRCFCSKCYKDYTADLNDQREKYARLKKALMLERAVRILERQAVNMYDLKDIIDQMEEYVIEEPEKFDSAFEMIAAIILADNGISAKLQYKVLKYRLDFLIPEYKIDLEIDGEFHGNNLYRDNQRDRDIRNALGDEWEVVRIGTKYLIQNAPALVEAMLAVRDEKKRLRAKHYGYLPDWYESRDKRKKKSTVGDDQLLDI